MDLHYLVYSLYLFLIHWEKTWGQNCWEARKASDKSWTLLKRFAKIAKHKLKNPTLRTIFSAETNTSAKRTLVSSTCFGRCAQTHHALTEGCCKRVATELRAPPDHSLGLQEYWDDLSPPKDWVKLQLAKRWQIDTEVASAAIEEYSRRVLPLPSAVQTAEMVVKAALGQALCASDRLQLGNKKISPKLFLTTIYLKPPGVMDVRALRVMDVSPRCLFFQGFKGLPEVSTLDVSPNDPGMSAGQLPWKLTLWAAFCQLWPSRHDGKSSAMRPPKSTHLHSWRMNPPRMVGMSWRGQT